MLLLLILLDDVARRMIVVPRLHGCDRIVLHGQVLVLGGGALILGAGLHSVTIVISYGHSLNIFCGTAWVLHIHCEAARCKLLIRLVC